MAGGAVAPLPSRLLPSASLYVGDLDPTVDEGDLHGAFSSPGQVASIRVCRDCRTGASLRYAYVNFFSRSHAENALRSLNHTVLRGKPMRIMWSQRDPFSRKSGLANLFVKNLDASVDGAKLEEMFSKYGAVLSCKVATEDDGQSKGFGFVQFDTEESAEAAIKALHGSDGQGNKKLYVAKFVRKSQRQPPNVPGCCNLYIKNLDESITDDTLLAKFSEFGKVRNALVMKDELGRSKGFGFVSFESPEHAKKAIEAMNGALLGSKAAYVGKALTRSEREKVQRQQFQEFKEVRDNLLQRIYKSNVYVKNLHASIADEDLREIFDGCGKIISAKVMRDVRGDSRGFGFVSFSSAKEAQKAISTLHGTMVNKRRLYVALAQGKEDRRRALQWEFARKHPTVPSRPQNQPFPIHAQRTSRKQQYGLRSSLTYHTGELTTSPVLPYQQGQMVYGNGIANWPSQFPYSIQTVPHAPFVSQWYPPVHSMRNILWMQGLPPVQIKVPLTPVVDVPKGLRGSKSAVQTLTLVADVVMANVRRQQS